MSIRVFMLGWEFPPFISGGLGTACYGLTRAMDRLGIRITFVLPKVRPLRFQGGVASDAGRQEQAVVAFQNVRFFPVASSLKPYSSVAQSRQADPIKQQAPVVAGTAAVRCLEAFESGEGSGGYHGDMFTAVRQFADKAVKIAADEDFDVVHAHDWMTFEAGIAVARAAGKPLLVHVHSTEFDRSGEHVNQPIYDIERKGMHAAHKVIAVSNYTRNLIISRYAVPPEKVEVVYNAVDDDSGDTNSLAQLLPAKTDKIVLFLGRITMQKGPEYFLYAAKKVLQKVQNVKFIMVGAGDMLYRCIELAAHLGIGRKVLFTRFLQGKDVEKAYRMADLYVMPSVSEPFGITPLEALRQNIPVLISKQSGVAEKLRNALKVDFWDVNEMANKMVAVLRHPALHATLRDEGAREIDKFRWEDSAGRVRQIYHQVLAHTQTVAK